MTEFDKMLYLLDMSWNLRSEIVPCLVGPPGIGKTAAVERHARKHGSNVVKIIASRCIPSEIVGMTMPDKETRSMAIYNSMQLESLRDGDILFLDELLEADQFVLKPLLTMIENREKADGSPLPDIQIIAATNGTTAPEQLEPQIRQRFMFQEFHIDKVGTRDYIKMLTGLTMTQEILDQIVPDGKDYNFLSSRSLTKLCMWIDQAKTSDELWCTATVINGIWNSRIGSDLARIRELRDAHAPAPKEQVRRALVSIAPDIIDESFENCSMSELFEKLQGLPDWEKICEKLAALPMEEVGETGDRIDF